MTAVSAQRIEEVALNAWPALSTYLYDGWIVRFAGGYTKRANSVTALYGGTIDAATKIRWCETLYRRQRLRPTFRLTPFSHPPDLDGRLAKRGYERIDTTSVQILSLGGSRGSPSPRTTLLPGEAGLDSWLTSFHKLNPQRRDQETHARLLKAAAGESCPMTLEVDGEVVACGLGVLDGEYLGLFDVVTAVEQRQKGYATELVEGLLAWGTAGGARHAYLQVMANNTAAIRLYARFGFMELYRYWYRVLGE